MPLFGDYYQHDLYAGYRRRWERIALAYLLRSLQLVRSGAFDLVWLEYELFPWLPAIGERLLARCRIPFVVDYDDDLVLDNVCYQRRLVRRRSNNPCGVNQRHYHGKTRPLRGRCQVYLVMKQPTKTLND